MATLEQKNLETQLMLVKENLYYERQITALVKARARYLIQELKRAQSLPKDHDPVGAQIQATNEILDFVKILQDEGTHFNGLAGVEPFNDQMADNDRIIKSLTV